MTPADERIARVVREYDHQGDHRTGTSVDEASGHWLADEVRSLGIEPLLERMAFHRVDVRAAYLEADGRRLEGLPLFDGGCTERDGISGVLGPLGSTADIGAIGLLPRDGERLGEIRRTASHQALVVVTGSELAPFNAELYEAPYGPPVLQLGGEHRALVDGWARHGATVGVVAAMSRQETSVFNVTARIEGTRPERSPIVVMTPRSGWWRCASERGGGIAIWLELMRDFARERPEASVFFLASTGHELGHFGLRRFLRERTSWLEDVHCWIHLGANLGAAGAPPATLRCSDAATRELALGAFRENEVPLPEAAAPGSSPPGEAREIHAGGGRYLSLIGKNALFHLRRDRWPGAVDVGALAALARAFVAIGRRMASSPGRR